MLGEIYKHTLHDLGDHIDERYRGIFSPLYDDALLTQFLTPQFTTESQWYIENCEHSEFTGRLLQRCFDTAAFDPSSNAIERILDIGSGAGNSIIPLLDQFPEQMIVASDLIPDKQARASTIAFAAAECRKYRIPSQYI
jgi:methylase of polypeptide subunit release factors